MIFFYKPVNHIAFVFMFLIAFLFISCDSGSGGAATPPEPLNVVFVSYPNSATETPYANPVTPVVAEAGKTTATVTLEDLEGQNVFLAKVNVSKTNTRETASTGRVTVYTKNGERFVPPRARLSGERISRELGRTVSGRAGGITRYDHEEARRFSANPPSISRTAAPRAISSNGTARAVADLNDTNYFWVQDKNGSFLQISATLRAQEDSCNVWVADENYSTVSIDKKDNKITTGQAEKVAQKFDGIRDRVTAVLGYEYGGDPDGSDPGGIDGDTRIQILVYDISQDYSRKQDSGIFGFFWGKDEFTTTEISSSNEAEIFYIDAHFTDLAPDYIYSTLVHEYQHMINFNRNQIEPLRPRNPDTWYNEMLSLITEDVFGPELDIEPYIYPRISRFPLFLSDYSFVGLTEWPEGDAVLSSYAFSYAFGAYLMRNYGGVALLKELMDNPYVETAAISWALNTLNTVNGTAFLYSSTDGFNKVFSEFVQTLIFSGNSIPSGFVSFDKEDSYNFGVGEDSYTVEAFDVWKVPNNLAGYSNVPVDYCGPLVWDLGDYPMKSYGIDLQSTEAWQNVTGTLTVEFSMPINADGVQMFLVVR